MSKDNLDRAFRKFGGAVAAMLTGLSAVAYTPTAAAQSADFDRFSVSLGLFVTSRDSKTRLDGQNPGSGTEIDLESDLGLDKSDSAFRLDSYFRFNEEHRLDFSYFDLSRGASKRLEREIEWDGTVYPLDVTVSADFDLAIYKLAYMWSFMRRDKGFLGLTAGLYVADIQTTIAAQSIAQRSGNGLTAPLPVIGLRGQYDLTGEWSLRGSAEFFALEYGDYSGSLYDLYAGLDYQLLDNMAVGIGINSVVLDVGVDKRGFSGDLNWEYTGGLLYMKFDL
jgi:hypothetical protein